MTDKTQADVTRLSALMQLEAMAREAESIKALQFLIVNETRKLIPFRQAFLFSTDKKHKNLFRVEAASSVSVIDRSSRLCRWLERTLSVLGKKLDLQKNQFIDAESCSASAREGWKDHSLPFVLWCPLKLSGQKGRKIGGLWLAKETPWQDNEAVLVRRLADTYAHAWYALSGGERSERNRHFDRLVLLSLLFVVASFFLIPVRITALAPVEVIAKAPEIVSAPLNGVIADLIIPPNTMVKEGDLLLTFEDTGLRNQYEIAEKSLAVARAELRRSAQQAFRDAKSSSQVALLKAQVELKEAESDYAQELLQQVQVRSHKNGLLIYSTESDWEGKPVQIGEQIMQIANPNKIKLQIDLPVKDAIFLTEGSGIKVFLDVDPLHSLPATVTHASYEAKLTPEEVLAYKIHAELDEEDSLPRIGSRGTAKIYGERVSLFFYLFRRPLSALRQFVGV